MESVPIVPSHAIPAVTSTSSQPSEKGGLARETVPLLRLRDELLLRVFVHTINAELETQTVTRAALPLMSLEVAQLLRQASICRRLQSIVYDIVYSQGAVVLKGFQRWPPALACHTPGPLLYTYGRLWYTDANGVYDLHDDEPAYQIALPPPELRSLIKDLTIVIPVPGPHHPLSNWTALLHAGYGYNTYQELSRHLRWYDDGNHLSHIVNYSLPDYANEKAEWLKPVRDLPPLFTEAKRVCVRFELSECWFEDVIQDSPNFEDMKQWLGDELEAHSEVKAMMGAGRLLIEVPKFWGASTAWARLGSRDVVSRKWQFV